MGKKKDQALKQPKVEVAPPVTVQLTYARWVALLGYMTQTWKIMDPDSNGPHRLQLGSLIQDVASQADVDLGGTSG